MLISDILPPGRCSQLPGTAELQIQQELVTLTWHSGERGHCWGHELCLISDISLGAESPCPHRDVSLRPSQCLAWSQRCQCHSNPEHGSLCRKRSAERGSSERRLPLGSAVSPVLPDTAWWLGWMNGCSTKWWTSGMKSCFRSCEMLPVQEASEVLILNKSKLSETLCEHLSLCLWVLSLNQAHNGQVRNKMLKGSRSTEKRFQHFNKWLSFQSHQPSVWYLWPKPTRAQAEGTGVSHLESYHLHPFPRNQRCHFQSWIQTTNLRNVVHYAVDWKKAHIVQANVFLHLISLLCRLPTKRCQQSELPFPKLAVPISSWGQS